MSNYDTTKSRLEYEEAKLSALLAQTKLARTLIKSLKTELDKSEPETMKKNKKDSEDQSLVEVKEENGYETLVFTDGVTTKIVTVRK